MRASLEEKLAHPVPPAVRHAMLEDRQGLAPGAADVVKRLFVAMVVNRDPSALPSAASFRTAAASESSFRLLLRTLTAYAPQFCTAEAMAVSAEWYAQRPRKTRPDTELAAAKTTGTKWPPAWRKLLPALQSAPIKDSSKKRYIASIDRCAAIVRAGRAPSDFGFLTAADLADAFTFYEIETKRVKPVTAAGYIEGLIALGRFGGIDQVHLEPMRLITDELRQQARLMPKNKEARISVLMERGGLAFVADQIGALRDRAAALPAHSAAGRRALQTAMVCGMIINKPPRKGDMVQWRIGQEIVRRSDGVWQATWKQEKTGQQTEAGYLWAEIAEILDDWILGGRPARLLPIRYHGFEGQYLLSLSGDPAYRNLPSALTQMALGVPSHDLRTVAADYMRQNDPEHAADVISAHLGHGTRRSGVSYQTDSSAAVGEAEWRRSRTTILRTNSRQLSKL